MDDNVFSTAPDWIEEYPRLRKRSLVISVLVSLAVLTLAWFIAVWLFVIAVAGSVVWLYLELKAPFTRVWDHRHIRLTPEGLVQSGSNASGEEPFELVIPWKHLKLTKLRKRGDSVHSIHVRDTRSGRHGFGAFLDHELKHFVEMDRLASEIEARIDR